LPECLCDSHVEIALWWRRLLWEIAQEQIEPRRPRTCPRVLKHQVSNYGKKHPHHRGPNQAQIIPGTGGYDYLNSIGIWRQLADADNDQINGTAPRRAGYRPL
jgi:hypothetical protein